MKTVVFVLAFFFGKSAAKLQLREIIPICDVKDSNLNSCVVKSANLLIPHLSKGIKSYKFPPLDPLKVPRMDIGQNNGPVSLELKMNNTTHIGLSTMKFHSASIDTKRNRWVLNATLPYYSLSGKYKANGKVLLVPIVGNGDANFTFHDVGIDFVITGSPPREKSNSYFSLSNLRVHFKFGKTSVVLTNLFNGNKVLGERTSKFLNDNSEEVVNGLKSAIEDVYSALYMNLIKRITSTVPYSELFQNV